MNFGIASPYSCSATQRFSKAPSDHLDLASNPEAEQLRRLATGNHIHLAHFDRPTVVEMRAVPACSDGSVVVLHLNGKVSAKYFLGLRVRPVGNANLVR